MRRDSELPVFKDYSCDEPIIADLVYEEVSLRTLGQSRIVIPFPNEALGRIITTPNGSYYEFFVRSLNMVSLNSFHPDQRLSHSVYLVGTGLTTINRKR